MVQKLTAGRGHGIPAVAWLDRALRLMLRSSVNRLLDARVFKQELTNQSDLGWRGPPEHPLVERAGEGGTDPLPQAESPDRRSSINCSDVGYDPRYRSIKRLSTQDELRFVALAQAGDRFARQKLVMHYLPLLLGVARHYRHRGLSLSELVNEGAFGLVRAIERFDRARKVRFGTYAKWWMRDAMDQAICQQGRLVRLPSNLLRALRLRGRPEKESSRPRQNDDTDANGTVLLEPPVDHPPDSVDHATPEVLVDEMEQSYLLGRALEQLTQREREVLAARYGLDGGSPQTLQHVAGELGLSHERVRQIQKTALARLKQSLHDSL